MKKWLVAVIFVSLAVIGGLTWYCIDLRSDLKAKQVELATAQETIKVKDAKIKTDEEVLVLLRKYNSALLEERDKMDTALSELMQKPENKEWGCTNLPEDITNFLTGGRCQRYE